MNIIGSFEQSGILYIFLTKKHYNSLLFCKNIKVLYKNSLCKYNFLIYYCNSNYYVLCSFKLSKVFYNFQYNVTILVQTIICYCELRGGVDAQY